MLYWLKLRFIAELAETAVKPNLQRLSAIMNCFREQLHVNTFLQEAKTVSSFFLTNVSVVW
jgi:hypothetical protein